MRVHPDKPFVGDLCFVDTYGMTVDQVNLFADRGVLFTTSWDNPDDGHNYGGIVVATSWAEAEIVAEARGLGEKVVGTLGAMIPANQHGAPIKRGRTNEDHDLRRRMGL